MARPAAERPILKTPEEIKIMRRPGQVVARILRRIGELVVPGATMRAIDAEVEAMILAAGGVPSFKNYPSGRAGVRAFPACICASINEVVVHGIPDDRVLREGDIVSVDVGVHLDGFCGDAARTYAVGEIARKAQKLLAATEAALDKAVKAARPGGWLKDIAAAVEGTAKANGLSVVRQFVGHGVGRDMHEPPQVPNYVEGLLDRYSGEKGLDKLRLETGMVLAIEPMLNLGGAEVLVDRKDGWSVFTRDRSWSAHFEHTVAITENGPLVLTAD